MAYNKHTWVTGETISTSKLNNIENGVDNAQEKLTAGDNITIIGNVISATGGGSGTTVIANPTLSGTEADLTGLQVGTIKYKVSSGNDSDRLVLTPLDYKTISKCTAEKLSCGPGIVSYGNGNFAFDYLADEVNTVETESSTTIKCRLGTFNILRPESAEFLDIATAGQKIGDVTIANKSPYEPNLLALNDSTLILVFNITTTTGQYIYYAATYSTSSKSITSYQPLKLDGRDWTPANIATSYNAISSTQISSSGPSSSMVFTSKIIKHNNVFYGYCGGVCSNFAGMVVTSTDGINWTSLFAPNASGMGMAGVIECGFAIKGNNMFLCMRDISSGVYKAIYNISTKAAVVTTAKITSPSLTTSKPCAFTDENGQIYVIVNKNTGDDTTVGRRNTALIFKVNSDTAAMTLVKTIFCRDGVAYHAVEKYNETNYWCFHTDARRISPYTQGRSNLTFMVMPKLPSSTVVTYTLQSISANATTTNYTEGDCFSTNGLTITGTFLSSEGNTVTNAISPDACSFVPSLTTPLTTGDTSVSISYTYSGVSKSTSLPITVRSAASLDHIAVTTNPTKMTYSQHSKFDPSGMVVTAYYQDSTSEPVNSYTYSPTGSLETVGTQVITITYRGKTTTLNVTVEEVTSEDIDLSKYTTQKGCIQSSDGKWNSDVTNTCYIIPLTDYPGATSLYVKAHSSMKAYTSIFTSEPTSGQTPPYATGYTAQSILDAGTEATYNIPSDAHYLFVLATNGSGASLVPTKLTINY